MPAITMQSIPDLMTARTDVDDVSVQRIRKTAESPPRVSVYDVLGLVTGYPPEQRHVLFNRLCDQFPEVRTLCTSFKFTGRGQRETPVTDAEGITQLIMILPGRAAALVRQSAASVVVRYLGGDVSLVHEILAKHQLQAQVTVENPVSIFGQAASTTRQGPTPCDLLMYSNSRMQALTTAFQLAQAIDSSAQALIRVEAQKAIDDILTPPSEAMGLRTPEDTSDQYVDAAGILRERAHTEEQIARLAGELGKDLKMVSTDEGRPTSSIDHDFGTDNHPVDVYHRVRDASLIEAVLASFKCRPLYTRVMAGDIDPTVRRRQNLLGVHGRGRSRSQIRSE